METILVGRRGLVRLGLLGTALGTLLGCAEVRDEARPAGQTASVGTLVLALSTGGQDTYRLVNAVFEVDDPRGETVTRLFSERDGGADALREELPQGDYALALQSGWRLEKAVDDAEFEPVQAALLTANPRAFSVKHGHLTELVYAFTTDDGVVTLGRGDVSVGIEINDTAALAECALLDLGSCPNGQTCLLAADDGRTFCAQPGDLEVGAPCDSEQCVAGAQCLDSGGDGGVGKTCQRFCDPTAQFPTCTCASLAFDDAVGVCTGDVCPGCNGAAVFTFEDSFGDDVASDALYQFFAGLGEVPDDWYIRFQIDADGGQTSGAWCSERADFYVSSYLSYATGGTALVSGDWQRHWRAQAGEWQGPTRNSQVNYYGGSCQSSYSWCSEWGLGSQFLGVTPAASWPEVYNGSFGATLTIAVGPSRSAACGF